MNFQTANRVTVNPHNYFATVSLPFPTPVGAASGVPTSSRHKIRASARHSIRPRELECAEPDFACRGIAKRFLFPCLAALVLGKALSYAVQFSAFILFLLH